MIGVVFVTTLGTLSCVAQPLRATTAVDPNRPNEVNPGKSVAILVDPEAPSRSVNEDLATKIGRLLVKHGYEPAPANTADLFIFFGYGTEEVDASTYNHHIDMAVLDAESLRRDNESAVVWRGVASLVETRSKNPARPVDTLESGFALLVEMLGESGTRTQGHWPGHVSTTPRDSDERASREQMMKDAYRQIRANQMPKPNDPN